VSCIMHIMQHGMVRYGILLRAKEAIGSIHLMSRVALSRGQRNDGLIRGAHHCPELALHYTRQSVPRNVKYECGASFLFLPVSAVFFHLASG